MPACRIDSSKDVVKSPRARGFKPSVLLKGSASMTEVCTRGIDTGFVALGYAKVAFLGVVQGITELLPISSTAHMRLVPAMLGWQDPGSAFSAAMQLAALAAVVSYFWGDVRGLATNSLRAIAQRQFHNRDLRFSIWIILATIPISIAGLLL